MSFIARLRAKWEKRQQSKRERYAERRGFATVQELDALQEDNVRSRASQDTVPPATPGL